MVGRHSGMKKLYTFSYDVSAYYSSNSAQISQIVGKDTVLFLFRGLLPTRGICFNYFCVHRLPTLTGDQEPQTILVVSKIALDCGPWDTAHGITTRVTTSMPTFVK